MQWRKSVQFIFSELQLKLIPLMHNAKIIQSLMIQDQSLISSQNTVPDISEMKGREITEVKEQVTNL